MIEDRGQQGRDEQYLAIALGDFINRWAPENARERRDFEYETYALFQITARVAQAPLAKHMSAAMALMPVPPMFVKKEPGQ